MAPASFRVVRFMMPISRVLATGYAMKRSAKITKAIERMNRTEAAFKATVAEVQKACRHEVILERPSGFTRYQYMEDVWNPAVRICPHCGYIEECRYGWPGTTTATPLYNTKPESRSKLNRSDFEISNDRLHNEIIHGVVGN
jgi:hypothetical protein